MLLARYEKAKTLARSGSSQKFIELEKRYGRWQLGLTLAGFIGFALLFFGDRIFGEDSRFLTVLLPAFLVAAFLFGAHVLRDKQDILTLAKRLQSELAPPQ